MQGSQFGAGHGRTRGLRRSKAQPACSRRGIASGRRFFTWQRNRKRSNSARRASSSGKWLDAENSDNNGKR